MDLVKSCVRKNRKRRGRPKKLYGAERDVVVASDSDIFRCNEAFWKTYESAEAQKKKEVVARKVTTMATEIGVTGGPIWLECDVLNWGPKPFRFNNC